MIVLLLNASFEPLNICSWQRAMKLLYNDKVDIIHTNGKLINGVIPSPSVLKLKEYVKIPQKRISLCKSNILYRDNYTCQYCGIQFDKSKLTIDHVIPKSRGGKNIWDNVVTACYKCNNKKGNKLLNETQLSLLKEPKTPKLGINFLLKKKIGFKYDEKWDEYLT